MYLAKGKCASSSGTTTVNVPQIGTAASASANTQKLILCPPSVTLRSGFLELRRGMDSGCAAGI